MFVEPAVHVRHDRAGVAALVVLPADQVELLHRRVRNIVLGVEEHVRDAEVDVVDAGEPPEADFVLRAVTRVEALQLVYKELREAVLLEVHDVVVVAEVVFDALHELPGRRGVEEILHTIGERLRHVDRLRLVLAEKLHRAPQPPEVLYANLRDLLPGAEHLLPRLPLPSGLVGAVEGEGVAAGVEVRRVGVLERAKRKVAALRVDAAELAGEIPPAAEDPLREVHRAVERRERVHPPVDLADRPLAVDFRVVADDHHAGRDVPLAREGLHDEPLVGQGVVVDAQFPDRRRVADEHDSRRRLPLPLVLRRHQLRLGASRLLEDVLKKIPCPGD